MQQHFVKQTSWDFHFHMGVFGFQQIPMEVLTALMTPVLLRARRASPEALGARGMSFA